MKKQRELIDHDVLLSALRYEPETGQFYWSEWWDGRLAGKCAGTVTLNGYRQIHLSGQYYLAHRLAWFYVHGQWPKNYIDHINNDKLDNRIANLRDTTQKVNMRNLKRPRRDNASGFTGVSFHKQSGKFMARITDLDGSYRYLGLYPSAELASSAYQEARAKIEEEAVA